MALSCIISETELVENRDFFIPPYASDAPIRILPPRLVWKKGNGGLPDDEKSFEDRRMYNRLDRIPACDGRTDGHLAAA